MWLTDGFGRSREQCARTVIHVQLPYMVLTCRVMGALLYSYCTALDLHSCHVTTTQLPCGSSYVAPIQLLCGHMSQKRITFEFTSIHQFYEIFLLLEFRIQCSFQSDTAPLTCGCHTASVWLPYSYHSAAVYEPPE